MTLQKRLREAHLSTGASYLQEAADALDAKDERIKRLEKALRECADDLEAELVARYDGTLNYPVMKRRYDSDIGAVQRARAALDPSAE